MNFKQLETFRAVMLTGSMTVAAQRLHTSQPNVSRVIGQLEAETGFELFDRTAARLIPTKGGEAFFREIERSFVGLESIADSARAIRDLGSGTLRIASAASISMSVLPLAIRMFSERYPSVRIVADTSNSSTIANWIATQHCDIGFVSSYPDKPGVIASLIHAENAVCIMPPQHRLARKEYITPLDLEGERFISLPNGSPSRRTVDAEFSNINRIMALETPFASTICRMVSEQLGLSIVNPIVSRTLKIPGIIAIPFKPEIQFKSYLLKPQLAATDAHTDFLASCMKNAFEKH